MTTTIAWLSVTLFTIAMVYYPAQTTVLLLFTLAIARYHYR